MFCDKDIYKEVTNINGKKNLLLAAIVVGMSTTMPMAKAVDYTDFHSSTTTFNDFANDTTKSRRYILDDNIDLCTNAETLSGTGYNNNILIEGNNKTIFQSFDEGGDWAFTSQSGYAPKSVIIQNLGSFTLDSTNPETHKKVYTVTNTGYASNRSDGKSYGAFFLANDSTPSIITLTVDNVVISDLDAQNGSNAGLIALNAGSTIQNSLFKNNTQSGIITLRYDGTIRDTNDVNILNTAFVNNTHSYGYYDNTDGYTGFIFAPVFRINDGGSTNKLYVKDSYFEGNKGTRGGGLIYWNTQNGVEVDNSLFINNGTSYAGLSTSQAIGGAIDTTSLSIKDSYFEGNYHKNTYTGTIDPYYPVQAGGAISSTLYKNTTSSTVSIDNTDFKGNYVNNTKADALGGAIYLKDANTTITNGSDFTGNYAKSTNGNAYGGAIYNEGGSLSISGSKLTKNYTMSTSSSSDIYGGAVYNAGTITSITDTQFGGVDNTNPSNPISLGNIVSSWHHGYGGALYNTGEIGTINADFTSNTIDAKQYSFGGAISNQGKITNIQGTFEGNKANGSSTYANASGGAIYNRYQYDSEYNPIENTGIIGNITANFINNSVTATKGQVEGGAIYTRTPYADDLKITNSTFTGNNAEVSYSGNINASGGAIHSSGGTLKVSDSTFDNNHVKAYQTASNSYLASACGGAIYVYEGSADIKDSVFTNNNAQAQGKATSSTGGALYLGWGEFNIKDSTFTNNSVSNITSDTFSSNKPRGGAILFGDGIISLMGTLSDADKAKINAQDYSDITFKTVFDNNSAEQGGAIYTVNDDYGDRAITTIDGVMFKNNTASIYGGAIQAADDKDLRISNSVFKSNTLTGEDAKGSGLYFLHDYSYKTANLTLDNVLFIDNNQGGALYLDNVKADITDTSFESNLSGAIRAASKTATGYDYSVDPAVQVTNILNPEINITADTKNVIFKGNKADNGAAIYSVAQSEEVDGTTYGSGNVTLFAKNSNIEFTNNNSTGTSEGTGTAIEVHAGDLILNANADKSITITDGILTEKINNIGGNLNINTDNNAGTVDLSGTITNGGATNIYGGTLKLSGDALTNKFDTFNVNGNSTIDLSNNGSATDNLKINNFANKSTVVAAPILTLNVDYDGTADSNGYGSMDKLTVDTNYADYIMIDDAWVKRHVEVDLNNINILTDGDATKAVFLDGEGASNVTIANSSTPIEIATSGGWQYTFTHDGTTKGLLNIVAIGQQHNLPALIQDATLGINRYSITTDDYKPFQIKKEGIEPAQYYTSLGELSGANREFTISGGTSTSMHSIDGITMDSSKGDGVTIGSGQTLNLRNISQFKNFTTAVDNSGTLNVENVTFTDNTTDIINSGTANIADSTINSIQNTGTLNVSADNMSILGTITDNGTATPEGIMNINSGSGFVNVSNVTQDKIYLKGGRLVSGGTINVNQIIADENYSSSDARESFAVGGAFYNEGTFTGTITGKFKDNSANTIGDAYGGAIYNTYNSLTLNDVDFEGNFAKSTGSNAKGGAFYAYSNNTEVEDSLYTSNKAESTNGYAYGGAIYQEGGTLTISGSTFNSNTADQGGAINDDNTGSLTIQNSQFSNNTSSMGTVYSYKSGTAQTLTIKGSSFTNNKGSAIWAQGGTVLIEDTNIVNTDKTDTDSAIVLYQSPSVSTTNIVAKIADVEISGNSGYGIYAENGAYDGSVTLYAQGGNILIDNNDLGGIYNKGLALTLNADKVGDTVHTITINDVVSSTTGMTINADNNGGTVALNGALTLGGDTNINGGTLKLGTAAATSKFNNVAFVNNPILDLQNSKADTLNINKITGDAKLNIDVNSATSVSDAIQIATIGSSGTLTVNSLSFLDNVTIPESFNINVITKGIEGDISGITLAIDPTLAAQYNNLTPTATDYDKPYTYNSNITFDTTNFTSEKWTKTTQKQLTVVNSETAKGLKLNVNEISDVHKADGAEDTHYDALQILNQNEGTRILTANGAAATSYTVCDDLGTTGAGILTVEGVAGSELNMNGKTGFELTKTGTALNLKNLNITGLADENTSLLGIANLEGTKANLENITISQVITKDVINNLGELNFEGTNTINSYIGGTGTTNINGGKTTLAKLVQNTVNITAGELEASDITAAINNGGILTLKGNNSNTINNYIDSESVVHEGRTVIAESLTNTGSINQAINVNASKTLTTNANLIGGTVKNSGTVELTGGTLSGNVTGIGSTIVTGTVTNNANISTITQINGGTLNNTNGQLSNVTITSGSLKSNANNVGVVNNSGTYEITGGTIANIISGNGSINITGNTTNNVINTNTGAVSVANNIELAVGKSGDAFASASSLTMGNGSILNIQNDTTTNSVINNLVIAKDDNVNVKMDWNDTLNSTSSNILGTLTVTDINMATTTSSIEEAGYTFTNLADKISLATPTNLIGVTDTTNNFVKYDNKTGILSSYRNNLVRAVDKTESGQVTTYVMMKDETAEGQELDGTLKVQGDGHTITTAGIKVGSATISNAALQLENTNMNVIGKALEVFGGNKVTVKAEGHDITLQTIDNSEVVSLNKGTTTYANAELSGSNNINIMGDIKSDDVNNILTIAKGVTVNHNGLLDPITLDVNGTENRTGGYDETVTYNINAGGSVNFTNDATLYDPSHHTAAMLNTINFNGGSVNTINGIATNIKLSNMSLNGTSNFYADVDLKNSTMDKFTVNNPVTGVGKLNVAGLNLISDAITDNTTINFTTDPILMAATSYTGSQGLTALSPIYKYNVGYDNTTGNFNFARFSSGGYGDYNPGILASPIAAQIGGYLIQLNSYDEAFRNMDMYMLMPKSERQALKLRNKYASNSDELSYNSDKTAVENHAAWFRPYVTFESVKLKRGPKVDNNLYGTFAGFDSGIRELRNGWDGIWGIYAGYNGSHQNYEGVGIYQNGGTLGLTGMLYKDNFFTGLTANVGANAGNASTTFGNDDFAMLMTGIASKTGYNWELTDGKFIIQPSYKIAYTMVNTFDYTNAAGVRVNSDPLNAITIEPGVKFIGNLPNGWQPYAGISMVWNIIDKTEVKANDVSLPNMSVKPFVKYGVGVRKTWGERLTGFFQTFITNGGRNGIGLQAGFNWKLGKENPSTIKKSQNKMPEREKTTIVLKGNKI